VARLRSVSPGALLANTVHDLITVAEPIDHLFNQVDVVRKVGIDAENGISIRCKQARDQSGSVAAIVSHTGVRLLATGGPILNPSCT
jgi:hypothetical protein